MENNSAVIFCRVSTTGQADRDGDNSSRKKKHDRWSLPVQQEFNEKYLKSHKLKLAHEPFVVTESGYGDNGHKRGDRRKFQAMIDFITERRIAHLIVLNEERLSRDFRGMIALDDLSRDFLTIHFTESGALIDKDTPSERRTFWAVKVAFARQYIDDLKEKARRSFEGRLDSGLYPSNPPLGYRCKKNVLTPHEAEAPIVRRMFENYASGLYSEFALAEKMYEEGLRKRKGGKVSVTTIAYVLRNPLYIGYVTWPFNESKYVSTEHTKGEWIKGQHEAIIDRSVWDRVQEVLSERAHPWSKRNNFQAYRGLMRCGACGKAMTPYTAKGHIYYYSIHPRGSRCQHNQGYPERVVEEKIMEALSRFTFDKEIYDWLRATLRATSADNQAALRAERKRIQTDLNKCQGNIDRIFNQALDEIFDPATVRAKVAEIRLRQGQLQDARKRLEKDASSAVDEGLLLLELVQDLPRTFRESSPEQRAKLVRLLFKKVVVLDGKFDFTPNEVFAPLYGTRFYKRREWLPVCNPLHNHSPSDP